MPSFISYSSDLLFRKSRANFTASVTSSSAPHVSSFNHTSQDTPCVRSHSYDDIIAQTNSNFNSTHYPLLKDGWNEEQLLLTALNPSTKHVTEVLSRVKPTPFTRVVSSYFEQSETATKLCLQLYRNIHRAHELYKPIHDLTEAFPSDKLDFTESQCNQVFEDLNKFDLLENPLQCFESRIFNEILGCFSQLENQLSRRLRKSKSDVSLAKRTNGSSIRHQLVENARIGYLTCSYSLSRIAGYLCGLYSPSRLRKSDLAHIRLMEAERCIFVLTRKLETIRPLVTRLQDAVESDKGFIRGALERGKESFVILLMVEHFRKSSFNISERLRHLEEQIRCWFEHVNVARFRLLQEFR